MSGARRPAVLFSLLVLATLLSGCHPVATAARPDLAPVADRVEASAGAVRKNVQAADVKIGTAQTETLQIAGLLFAVPEAKPLTTSVVPKLQSARDDLRQADAAAGTLLGPVLDDLAARDREIAALAKNRDYWEEKAAAETARADDAVRQRLVWVAIAAAVGLAGAVAAIFFAPAGFRQWAIVGAAGCGILFAVATALYRWYAWLSWAGLAILGAGVGLLLWAAIVNRKALLQLIKGGDKFQQAVAQLKDLSADLRAQVIDLFRTEQQKAQDPAIQAAVDAVRMPDSETTVQPAAPPAGTGT